MPRVSTGDQEQEVFYKLVMALRKRCIALTPPASMNRLAGPWNATGSIDARSWIWASAAARRGGLGLATDARMVPDDTVNSI